MLTLITLHFPSYWINSVLCYAVGILINEHRSSLNFIFKKLSIGLLFLGFVICYVATRIIYYPISIITAVFFCLLCYSLTYYFTFKTKFIAWIGNNSFEFYLFHIFLYNVFKFTMSYGKVCYMLAVLISSIICVYIYVSIRDILRKKNIFKKSN